LVKNSDGEELSILWYLILWIFFFTSIPGIMAPVAGHLIKLSLGKCLDGSIISNTPEHFLRTIQKPITSAF
jgi:hypothetical protein